MTRISRVRRLKTIQSSFLPISSSSRAPFLSAPCHHSPQHQVSRLLSTTSSPQASKRTDWVRSKLWKGEAPGPEDPYAPRSEDTVDTSNLPEEALAARQADKPIPYTLQHSRLNLPPQRSEAASEGEIRTRDAMYQPAESIEELEEIPALKSWWEQPGNWGSESEFKGFGLAAAKKVLDKDVMEVYLRRATIESLALRAERNDVFDEWIVKRWNEGGREELDMALALGVDAQGVLRGDVTSVVQSLMAEEDRAEGTERVTVEEAREMVKAADQEWKEVVVDERLKFAIRKRLYQLTGNLLPDSKLAAAKTVRHILTLASKPPKAKTLYEVLEKDEDLLTLPNLSMRHRRITPIDKEIQLGRWKVIEEELKKRDLPVTGSGGHDGKKEKTWIMPKRKMVRGIGNTSTSWE